MIPIIVIGTRDYAEYTNSGKVINLIADELPFKYIGYYTDGEKAEKENEETVSPREKVLELLHKEVAGCFTFKGGSEIYKPEVFQHGFQIYLKDIIAKAKGEIK